MGIPENHCLQKETSEFERTKGSFRLEIQGITVQTLKNGQEEFLIRVAYCQTVNGGKFENLCSGYYVETLQTILFCIMVD